MEIMEVDSPGEERGGGASPQLPILVPHTFSISGSSTDDEEGELARAGGGAGGPPRLPATWAFSQRAAGGGASGQEEAPGAPTRRRLRMGLRVHYPSQTAAPSRGFPDFLLRAPAAGAAEPDSSSSSETEIEEEEEEEATDARGAAEEEEAAGEPSPPVALRPPGNGDSGPPVDGGSDDPPDAQAASAGPASPLPAPNEEGEGDTCTICFEAWTTAGDHRLSALRCGHLFGFTCIQRWLKAQGPSARCPQCNKKAKRSDIVLLYASRLRALDNSQQESLKRSLEQEQSLRRKAELESAQYKLKLQVVSNQYGQTQQELQELKALMAGKGSAPSSSTAWPSSPAADEGSGSSRYGFFKAVLLSQAGGCRVLSYCEPLSCLLSSQPSPEPAFMPGCGVKKVSMLNTKVSQYVHIHSKQIRGLAFNRQNDSLLLSAALDSTLKLTSLLTNTVVQTYAPAKPVWSCCWCLDNSNYIYAGLSNGSVLVYDTRDTSAHVQELQPPRSRCPVASLCYVPRAASGSFPCGGLIAGSLEGGCFWERVDETTYRPHVLPLEATGCTDIQVEAQSRRCLVTYRPGRSNPTLRCVLMALTRSPVQEAGQPHSCSCSPLQTFSAGSSCKLLTKNAVFRSPGGAGTLVCAGDEASTSTMVWDAGSGSLLQKLPADLPVLDISPFSLNGVHYLASLTEKMLKLYRWE